MVELGWDTMQVVEGQDSVVCSTMPIVGQPPFRQIIRSAEMWKPELLKGAPVVLLAFMALLFAGVIGGRVITEMHKERSLRIEIKGRLLGITT